MNINNTEIERKWLLPRWPDETLKPIKHHFMKQAYFIAEDDIECRLTCRITADTFGQMMEKYENPKLVIKRGTGLIRPEYEMPLTEEQFLKAQKWIKHPFIIKEVRVYDQPAYDHIVVSYVDPHTSTGFCYAEVEFDSVRQSAGYTLPAAFNGVEVTGDPQYSMRNYWRKLHE